MRKMYTQLMCPARHRLGKHRRAALPSDIAAAYSPIARQRTIAVRRNAAQDYTLAQPCYRRVYLALLRQTVPAQKSKIDLAYSAVLHCMSECRCRRSAPRDENGSARPGVKSVRRSKNKRYSLLRISERKSVCKRIGIMTVRRMGRHKRRL